jgi:hypothetical protein
MVTGFIIKDPGTGYEDAPTVVLSAPPANAPATADAIVSNGSVTGFVMTGGGSGYQSAPVVTIEPPPQLNGTTTARAFSLRSLLHVSDSGTASLLSRVYLGQLATAPNDPGLCTAESLLKQDALATAQRFTAAHMPLGQVIASGSGSVAIGGSLTRTITVPYNDPTNPFVHSYHPDHDNKNDRGEPVGAGVESPNMTRTCVFTFTSAPPSGSTVTNGWGSSVIGGTYEETMTGIHKDPLILSGTFELRRVSEIGTLSQ